MVDISETLEANSDQLNAVDIMGCDRVIKITRVEVKNNKEQPVWIYFEGDNNRPWKPSKGMRRALVAAWGKDSDAFIGKYAQLFFEPSVKYGGKEVGGIRIKALSDIAPRGIYCALRTSRHNAESYHIPLLEVTEATYPQEKFEKGLPAMAKAMQSGEMTLQQVIARCHKTGALTSEQLAELESHAPIDTTEDDNEEDIY